MEEQLLQLCHLPDQRKIIFLYCQPGRETHIFYLFNSRKIPPSAVQTFDLSQIAERLQVMSCISLDPDYKSWIDSILFHHYKVPPK